MMPQLRSISHSFTSTSASSSHHYYSAPQFSSSPPTAPRLANRRSRPFHINATTQELVTFQEVQHVASTRGITITLRTLGPAYRITCRNGGDAGPILAVTSGFTAPLFKLMHCDMLQIFTKGQRGEEGSRIRGGILGLGLLIGGATFAFGLEQGCQKAEILAINDDEAMHARLVRYYSRFGFKTCRVVTGGTLADLPHMLVWGGVGTRMDADVSEMLQKWSVAIRNSREERTQEDSEVNGTAEGYLGASPL